MAWHWRGAQGQVSKRGFATRPAAIADAVGRAIRMQKGRKPGAALEQPDRDRIDQLWPSLMRAGWGVYWEEG